MAKVQHNINKSISGPTEFEKKKQVYDNIKKMHEQKMAQRAPTKNIQQNQQNQQNQQPVKPIQPPMQPMQPVKPIQQNQQMQQMQQPKINPQTIVKNNTPMGKSILKQIDGSSQKNTTPKINQSAKPTSVKTLLQDIKKSIPLDSLADSHSITVGETLDTETTDESNNKATVSSAVKTKSRLAKRNIQYKNS